MSRVVSCERFWKALGATVEIWLCDMLRKMRPAAGENDNSGSDPGGRVFLLMEYPNGITIIAYSILNKSQFQNINYNISP